MLSRIQNYLFPALIAGFALSYWLQIKGQRQSVVMFPAAILVLIAILLAVVIIDEWRKPEETPAPNLRDLRPVAILIGMSVFYYFSLITLGFDISNFWFSLIGSLVMGLNVTRSMLVAVCTTVILFALSRAMEFNTPQPFWL